MNKIFLALIFSQMIVLQLFAQETLIKQQFPNVEVRKLDDSKMFLPSDLPKLYTCLAIIESAEAQNQLNKWIQPLYDAFEGGMMPGKVYALAPMKAFNVSPKKVEEKLKQTDETLKDYILLYDGDYQKFNKSLALKNQLELNLVLISPRGEVLKMVSGIYSDKKLEEFLDGIE